MHRLTSTRTAARRIPDPLGAGRGWRAPARVRRACGVSLRWVRSLAFSLRVEVRISVFRWWIRPASRPGQAGSFRCGKPGEFRRRSHRYPRSCGRRIYPSRHAPSDIHGQASARHSRRRSAPGGACAAPVCQVRPGPHAGYAPSREQRCASRRQCRAGWTGARRRPRGASGGAAIPRRRRAATRDPRPRPHPGTGRGDRGTGAPAHPLGRADASEREGAHAVANGGVRAGTRRVGCRGGAGQARASAGARHGTRRQGGGG
jgi:hypothetical protein